MKIKLKDLHENPYRDLENYPFVAEKLEQIENSIEETGFWDNIVCRKNGDGYQIAYGHHRLDVLRKMFDQEHEFDLPVKDLADAMMLKIMANENMEEWGASARVIDETVRVTKKFLEENPGEAKFLAESDEHRHRIAASGSRDQLEVGRRLISRFLGKGWPEPKVMRSLQRLNLIKEGVDKESMEKMSNPEASLHFAKAAKRHNLAPEEQQEIADTIVESGNYGAGAIERIIQEKIYKAPIKPKESEEDFRIRTVVGFFAEITNMSAELSEHIKKLRKIADDNIILSKKEDETFKFMARNLKDLSEELTNLMSLQQ